MRNVTPLTKCFSHGKKPTANFPYNFMRADCRTVFFLVSDIAAEIVPGFFHTHNIDILGRFSLRLYHERIQFL